MNSPDLPPESSTVEPGASVLSEQPTSGRTFSTTRCVSIDDCSPSGRMEFDGIARFLQDVGNDDTDDAGFAELGLAWVARRALINASNYPSARESLNLTTWASATGRRWAERRTSIRSEDGAAVDAATIWIHLDPTSGRPTPWGEHFAATYLPATGGRRVDARLRLPKEPPEGSATESAPWSFRKTDSDAYGHVNNAAYLAVAEEFLDLEAPCSVEVEWRSPTHAGTPLTALTSTEGSVRWLWLLDDAEQETRAVFKQGPPRAMPDDDLRTQD